MEKINKDFIRDNRKVCLHCYFPPHEICSECFFFLGECNSASTEDRVLHFKEMYQGDKYKDKTHSMLHSFVNILLVQECN